MANRPNVWLEAFDQPIGRLERRTSGDVAFVYAKGYVADPQVIFWHLLPPLEFADVGPSAFWSNLCAE
jgi:hypothetical protein